MLNKTFKLWLISGIFLNTMFCFSQRGKESINESWKHITEDVSGAEKPEFKDDLWQKLNLPHTWNATDAYTLKQYYRGVGWYRKDLNLTQKYIDKKLFINFEGVFVKADIYVNGKFVGEHKGGYTAFTYDISILCQFQVKTLSLLRLIIVKI